MRTRATATLFCAWVLWQGTEGNYTNAIPRGAFESRAACLDRMSSLAIELYQEGRRFEVQCLPDTTDPRGAKR